ncbi:Sir2 silent information regulator family NAD-dependent deacetylase [Clostridium sp. chh4-2]|uniref:SIR2 family NAD-dependent protein deacylase n=1 Tax=Clostridium sp. chh4-2 TaxID=2067550 RepID=UPI000CCDEBF6|nr:Sir2 silent information regulator family NAD-dependent deacetylase [Clostridium sp. chh4-2]PNV63240.1 Sir2 silent information regulator family NAD-dependent deacetylase [Clostridium sp. chh4-2]
MDWTKFLCSMPADDYIIQKNSYEEQIKKAVRFIREADTVLIGAGSGLSSAAGLTYSGARFTDNFGEFIEKYGMTDMYSAGFYPFPSEEERWGYWSKHAYMNRIAPPALPLYQTLFDLVKHKEYFVLTTNVDHQFRKAGFWEKRIFPTQGDYGLIQCAKGCHQKTYDAGTLFTEMNQVRSDCKIPSGMVPKCPVCNGPMAMNLRCDQYFVEDEQWQERAKAYGRYLEGCIKQKTLLLELGVGFNTPVIIRFPFEKMMRENKSFRLIRLNMGEAFVPESFGERAVGIDEDLQKSVTDMENLYGQEV